MIALGVVVMIALIAMFAPVIAALTGHGPNVQYPPPIGTTVDGLPKAPTSSFLFGTDDLGRDVLVRVAYGAQVSLLVGVLATLLAVVIGALVGLAAGYFGRVVDTVLARVIDVMLSIPFLLFAISLASVVSVTPLHIGPIKLAAGDRDRRVRDRHVQLGDGGAHRARPGARHPGEGVHRGGAFARGRLVADHRHRRPAERARADHRLRHAAHPA